MIITHISWLGYHNIGDDLMAEAIRYYFLKRFKDIRYYVWSEGYIKQTESIQSIYKISPRIKWLKQCQENICLKKSDILLVGGGSILHSENSIRWKLRGIKYIKEKRPTAKALGINLSIGPFRRDKEQSLCREFVQSLDAASFRDISSFEFACGCNPCYEPILSSDLAASFLEFSGIKPRVPVKTVRHVGLCLTPVRGYGISLVEQYSALVDKMSTMYKSVILFSFCKHSKYGDYELNVHIAKRIHKKNIHVIAYDGNINAFLGSMKTCDLFIPVRLHGAILAYLLKIPFIPISYHQKCESFLEMIGIQKKQYLDIQQPFADLIPKNMILNPTFSTEKFLQMSLLNFKIFDGII